VPPSRFSSGGIHNCTAGNLLRRSARLRSLSPSARLDPAPWGRSARTALYRSEHWGWAEILHPFHPLRGQRFQVLKTRRVGSVDTLILREPARGSFCVPREWTDRADPSLYDSLDLPPRRLDAALLLELAALLEQLTRKSEKGLHNELSWNIIRPVFYVVCYK